jgi:hypothetical protein
VLAACLLAWTQICHTWPHNNYIILFAFRDSVLQESIATIKFRYQSKQQYFRNTIMLVKDEMKFEQKLNQLGEKILPNKKGQAGGKKKLIALREVRHMLDEVTTRRSILRKENEETRKAIASMKQALTAMPKAVQEERAKLMLRNRQSQEAQQGGTMKMINENIRETLYAMNLTMSSMPLIVTASTTSSSCMSQQALCSTLLTNFSQHPCGQPNLPMIVPVMAQPQVPSSSEALILPKSVPSAAVPTIFGPGWSMDSILEGKSYS